MILSVERETFHDLPKRRPRCSWVASPIALPLPSWLCAAAAALWRNCAHSGSEIHASTFSECKPSDAAFLLRRRAAAIPVEAFTRASCMVGFERTQPWPALRLRTDQNSQCDPAAAQNRAFGPHAFISANVDGTASCTHSGRSWARPHGSLRRFVLPPRAYSSRCEEEVARVVCAKVVARRGGDRCGTSG